MGACPVQIGANVYIPEYHRIEDRAVALDFIRRTRSPS